ncbi:MAG: hypothetical protein J0I41_09960 [Filimonas sp.]|nr:hypothetical protein [Filimonas sp.]
MKFNFIEGTYNLSIFRIYIDSDDTFDQLSDLPDTVMRTFYHEYFHFIQDLTTPFTVNVMWQLYSSIAQLIAYAQQHGKEIYLPLSDIPELKNLETGRQFLNAIFGDVDCVIETEAAVNPLKVTKVSLIRRFDFLELAEAEQVRFVELTVSNSQGKIGTYSFGAIAVIETMTYLIQRKFFGDSSVDDAPYRMAYRVAELICPDWANNEEYLFAVCDLALKTLYPGWAFVVLLEELRTILPKPQSAEQIYDICLEILGREWKYPESFEQYKNNVITVASQLQGHDVFKINLEWFITIIQNGWQRGFDEPKIMLRLYQQWKPFNEYLLTLRNDLGMPEIVNRKKQRWFFLPKSLLKYETDIDPTILAAIAQLQDILLDGSCRCALIEQCQASSNKMPVDSDCQTRPWVKANHEPLCPFGAVWRSFGLNEYTIVFEEWFISKMDLVLDKEIIGMLWLKGVTYNTWIKAPIGDYMIRVDPPGSGGQLHIHIARSKHTRAKQKQVSWNIDGTRHDKRSFDESFRGMSQAKKIARQILGIPDNVILQHRRSLHYELSQIAEDEHSIEVQAFDLYTEEHSVL